MDRLEAALAVATPPAPGDAARAAGCPPDGVRALERAAGSSSSSRTWPMRATTYGRWRTARWRWPRRAPLTPAAFRDATGTSRKYVMAILADLDRRGDPAPNAGRPRPRAASAPGDRAAR